MTHWKATFPGFFGSALIVASLTSLVYFWDVGKWPWDHDEVSGLVEVGASQLHVAGAPAAQLSRIRLAVPVWYVAQRTALSFLPPNEWGSRLLSACCAVGIVIVLFIVGWTRGGAGLAYASTLVTGLSQPLIVVGQNNRFYAMALFFAMLTFSRFWAAPASLWIDLMSVALLTLLAIFSHNLLVVFFCLCFAASALAYIIGHADRLLVLRTGVAAAVSVAAYVLYLHFVIGGWASGGLGEASSLVTVAAAVGIPTIALALLGIVTGLRNESTRSYTIVLGLLLAGEVVFIGSWRLFLTNWNAWYAFLFLPPLWLVAAQGVADVGVALADWRRAGWYICIGLILLPNFVSYFRDGSRHDFRKSAAVVADHLREDERVYANWPSELQYYLNSLKPASVTGWWRTDPLPASECIIVYASNAFEPVIVPPGRSMKILGEIFTRRFDEQSYVVRIYQFGALAPARVQAR